MKNLHIREYERLLCNLHEFRNFQGLISPAPNKSESVKKITDQQELSIISN